MENEILIEKHNKKSWFKSAILGLIMGLAIIIPGVSGAQVAILFKLYDKFTYAIANILKKFKIMFLFLLPILIGMVVGFLAGLVGLKKLLEITTFPIVTFFAGMMLGGLPTYIEDINFKKISWVKILLIIIGLIIPISISVISVQTNISLTKDSLTEWWMFIAAAPIGLLVAVTQIIPGLSATSMLLSIGIYTPIYESVDMTYWGNNPTVFGFYALLGLGFLIGVWLLSKLASKFIEKFKPQFYALALGLSISSIASMFYNSDLVSVYKEWGEKGINTTELIVGIILFVVGACGIFLLFWISSKKEKQALKTTENIEE